MNDENSTRAYPLYWPESWPRTDGNKIKRAQFKDRSVFTARRELENEVRKFGGLKLIISSNLKLNLDGTLRSGQKQPADKGVAVFFERKNEPMALACDVYSTVEDNLWALVRTLEALRQIERDTWVICGGESGAGCRPFDYMWARDLREQCKRANVAFWRSRRGGIRMRDISWRICRVICRLGSCRDE